MLVALLTLALAQGPVDDVRHVSDKPLINLSLMIGAAAWRQTAAGTEGPAFSFGVRGEAFGRHRHVGFGGHVLVESTLGRDVVLGLGPALLLTGGHDLNHWPPPIEGSGVGFFPGVYVREAGGRSWQPGVGLGIAARWADRFGVGVDGRLELGVNAERAVLVTLQLDVFTPLAIGLFNAARKASPGTWI